MNTRAPVSFAGIVVLAVWAVIAWLAAVGLVRAVIWAWGWL